MRQDGIFAGDDPFAIARAWLAEAEAAEPMTPTPSPWPPWMRRWPAQCAHGAAEGDRGRRPSCSTPTTARPRRRNWPPGQGGLRAALEKPAPPDPGARACQPRRGAAGRCLLRQPQPEVAAGRLGQPAIAAAGKPRRPAGRGGEGDARSRDLNPNVRPSGAAFAFTPGDRVLGRWRFPVARPLSLDRQALEDPLGKSAA